jgi:A118 family predicted phage portal protein
MDIYSCQEAFGAFDKTSEAMQRAIAEWFSLYYRDKVEDGEDPCQRIAYTLVSKLVRGMFGEYNAATDSPFLQQMLRALDAVRSRAAQLALVGGESYLKPWLEGDQLRFTVIPRDKILIFAADAQGTPTDVGTMERSSLGGGFYTLLERRTVDAQGRLTIENRLFRSTQEEELGQQVSLGEHPAYRELAAKFTYEQPVHSVGLARLCAPMLNCVDGSNMGVSIYAAACPLIHAIDRNEHQLSGEFSRGESRVFVSGDLLKDGQLADNVFVGLDEDPQNVGVTVFSPELRHKAFLERKQEYLRNIESLVGIKRGLLCDANLDQRTATEITASATEHALTVMDLQNMWQEALEKAKNLCLWLAQVYDLEAQPGEVTLDWGNGVLYDEEKRWQDYKDMVARGLLAPEVALGWRFGLPADTDEQRARIRQKYMPK